MEDMFMKNSILTLLAMGFVFSVSAADIDTSKSELKWTGTKVTGKHFGKVKFKEGELDFEDGKIEDGEFEVDMTSITVDDLEGEWADKLVGHLKNDDFFSVDKYKTAKLDIDKAVLKGDTYTFTGKLTIKGKTNPVSFDAKKVDDKKYSGKLVFNRTKWDIKYGSGSFFEGLGDKMIHDDVTLEYTLVLK